MSHNPIHNNYIRPRDHKVTLCTSGGRDDVQNAAAVNPSASTIEAPLVSRRPIDRWHGRIIEPQIYG